MKRIHLMNCTGAITFLALLLCQARAVACTSFIVSGKATPDGRPLIFKNRDTGGMGIALGAGLALSAAYILLQTVSATFSTNAGLHPALAAWLPNILYTFITIYLYRKAPE